MQSSASASRANRGATGDRIGTFNLLTLLGQAAYELDRGDPRRALLYAGAALVSFQSRKASFAIQSVLTADRIMGKVAGERPLDSLLGGRRR